ncbi:MAG: DUF6600 domain-containing protein [Terriglobales bacterium]
MKNLRKSISSILAVMFIVCATTAVFADDDPPSRAARMTHVINQVSFQPAGVDDWALVAVNQPLTTSDNVWADVEARAELNLGSAAIRMGAETSLTLTNLSDNVVQLGLNQGTLNLRVKHIFDGETYEVDTPNLAFTLFQPGSYRFDVDPNGDTTVVTIWQGQGQATGDSPAVDLGPRQQARFTGGRSLQNQITAAPGFDSFDDWCRKYDESEDRSLSARYVSPNMIGYEDLDAAGQWRDDPQYGHLWVPAGVEVGWAPYHYGHWAWVAPWGWTWVDNAPWGFAPFHYGRWVNVGGVWAWAPGPVEAVVVRPVYAPALVAWVGGVGIGVGGGVGVGWFALGWGEPFIPAYPVSRNYFTTVNVHVTNITNITNTVYVNNTTVINNTAINNIHYVNRTVPGAVLVVPKESMGTAQPVSKIAVKVTPAQLESAKPVVVAPVAPQKQAVLGAPASQPAKAPPASVLARPLMAKTPPPPPPLTFASKQQALAKNPGQPVTPQEETQIRKTSPPPPQRPAPVIVKSSGSPAAGKPGAPPPPAKPGAPNTPPPGKPPVPQPPKPGTAPAPPPNRPPAPKPPPAPPEHQAAPEHTAPPPRPTEPPKPAPKPPEHQAAPEHAAPPSHAAEPPKPAPKPKPAEKPEKEKEKN